MANLLAVVGLGFGDEGKGSIVDALTRRHQARLVVRFNGGAQAAHNVVSKGRDHTFSQFGSGTLAGAATHLSRFMLIAPAAMMREERVLGCRPEVTVDEDALLLTPFHAAANRLREWQRGAACHGSCGWGIGETMADSIAMPDLAIRVRDIAKPTGLADKLDYWRQEKTDEFSDLLRRYEGVDVVDAARAALGRPRVSELCDVFASWATRVRVVGRDYLTEQLDGEGSVIFEGAQGVLLDETHGFAPHNTWSDCTFGNVDRLAEGRDFERIGVIRSYMTRHGAGPLPTEDAGLLPHVPEAHNGQHRWQGAWRVGHADMPLLSYAVERCGHIDSLAVTHWDRIAPLNLMATGVREDLTRVDLDSLDVVSEADMRPLFEMATIAPLRIVSRGPTADDKEWR